MDLQELNLPCVKGPGCWCRYDAVSFYQSCTESVFPIEFQETVAGQSDGGHVSGKAHMR